MDNVTARPPEDSVSMCADSTKDDDDTEDEVLIDVGREHGLNPTRAERRHKIGPGFKIALYQELQRVKGNPFLERKRKAKVKAWEALATRIRSVKKVTCKGSFGEKTFNVRTPEKCHGVFCSRYFTKERSKRKVQEKEEQEEQEETGAAPRSVPLEDIQKAEEEEFKRAYSRMLELEEIARTTPAKVVGKQGSQDADDGSSSQGEEDVPSEKETRKGKRRHEDIDEELEGEAFEPLVDDMDDVVDDGEISYSSVQEIAKLERLCAKLCSLGDKRQSGPGRSADDERISTKLNNFEDRVENHFSRISRDIRMIEDEMTRLRRSISSLHDDVLCLAQGHASGPRRGLI